MKRLLPKLVLGAVAIGYGAYLSRGIWHRYHAESVDAARARAEMRLAESRKADLVRQRADLSSESGKERQARDSGYLGPGEHSL